MRFALAVWGGVSVFVLSCWLAFAGAGDAVAQAKGKAPPSEAERVLQGLTGDSDADFDALIDPCIVANGKRICAAASDRDPAAAGEGQASGAAPAGNSHTERAVT